MTTRSQPDPIQAQLAEARRTQILDAATQVFAAKGFHRATIRDVAKAAGIADGTIYNYFENKTALLLGLLGRINESGQRAADFEKSNDGDIHSFVRRYVRHRFQVFQDTGFELLQVLLSEILVNSELRELYYQKVIGPTFETAKGYIYAWAEASGASLVDRELTPRVFSGMVLGLIMLRLLGDPVTAARWDDLPDLVAEIILSVITPTQGEQS